MVKLSIIVPHHNSALMLERLLKSIPDKEFIEIVIIDDHSSQEQLAKLNELIEKYSNRDINLLFNKFGKKSAGAARNKGLEFITGDWVLFADSDDYFLSGFYDVVSNYFFSDNDIVFFAPTSIYNDTQELAQRHVNYESFILEYLSQRDRLSALRLRYGFVVPWSKLFRTSFIKEYSIDFDEVMYSNDVMFSTKSGFYADKIEVSTANIYCVTRGKTSLTSKVNEDIFDIRLNVVLRRIRFLKENLSKEDFNKLGYNNGRPLLLKARRFGIRKVLEVYKILKEHRIEIFTVRVFNLVWIFDRYRKIRRRENSFKKYSS